MEPACTKPSRPRRARRLLDKIECITTPKHGSWLNMAETEIRIMNGQCLDRRLDSQEKIATEVAAPRKKSGTLSRHASTGPSPSLWHGRNCGNSTRQMKMDDPLGQFPNMLARRRALLGFRVELLQFLEFPLGVLKLAPGFQCSWGNLRHSLGYRVAVPGSQPPAGNSSNSLKSAGNTAQDARYVSSSGAGT